MQLPGGLVENGLRLRDWSFRPVSGDLELGLAEVGEEASNAPQAVTRALALALERLSSKTATPERVAGLCVADRQFLMRELDRHLGCEGDWFQTDCARCDARFDFRLDYAELPVQEAGEGYPIAHVEWDDRRLSFRLPTGSDQEMLANLPDAEAKPWLLRRLANEPEALGTPSEAFIALVEEALDAMSPGVVLRVQSTCPECGADNQVGLDPYRVIDRRSNDLLMEIHQIASHYHWSETEILKLPRTRRQRYLQIIDRARGMTE